MLVRFRNTDGSAPAQANPEQGTVPDLTPGKTYIVFAISIWRGRLGFCVLDDIGQRQGRRGIPLWYPATHFEIVDSTISDQWQLASHTPNEEVQDVLAFPEWASDGEYYARLVDREAAAVEVFLRRRLSFEGEHKVDTTQ